VRVLICRPGGRFEPAEVGTALADLQAAVGGYVQFIALPMDLVLMVDEEGKLKNRELNTEATRLFSPWLLPGDHLVGPVLLAGSTAGGRLRDLPEHLHLPKRPSTPGPRR
jgi:hypothetical protein